MDYEINWRRLLKALNFYQNKGYIYKEVPWIVSNEARGATYKSFTAYLNLIGSAEQSFIQLMLDDMIKPGKYCALSPCFRKDKIDFLHQPYFMKLELICIGEESSYPLQDAYELFSHYGEAEIVDTYEGKDILINGIEVGSYGVRRYRKHLWTYGTGIAEPRLSKAIKYRGKTEETI